MGCNESKEPKIDVDNNSTKKSSNVNNSNGKVQHNNAKSQQSQPETRAPLAFVIEFEETRKSGNTIRPPPGRLQLEPLKDRDSSANRSRLDEKMRAADEKRQQMLAERAKSSLSMKRRRNPNGEFDEDD